MRALSSGGLSKPAALKYSTIAILSVFLVEVILGLAVGSLAILSDGLHALFDTISSFILLLSAYISLRPPDEEHMYGHEKFEAIGSLIGSFILIVLATLIAVEAILGVLGGRNRINPDLNLIGFLALGYTLSVDIIRMIIFRSTLRRESPLIKVGFSHALLDLGSTLIALSGFWLSISFGLYYLDSIASLALSATLIVLSVRLAWGSIMELSDMAPSGTVMKIKEEIYNVSGGLFSCENLKVRKAGDKFFIRATLRAPDYMSLSEAHEVANRIEERILGIFGGADISFHIEPPDVKSASTRKIIEKIAGGFKGVAGVHDVNIRYCGGKIYVTLHVQVDPSMPLSEAHDLAEKIEEAIFRSISNIGDVLVHIEPSNIELKRGLMLSEEEISRFVQLAAEKYKGALRIKRITAYAVNESHHIDIECSFSMEVSVEEAHKIASEIEDFIKERISEVTVTVHMEPEGAGR